MKFLQFNYRYFFITVLIFCVEVFIALFVKDTFIRPFLGDVIVVWFVYYFIKTFVNLKPIYIAVFTLLFSFAVEIGQYFNLVNILGLQDYKWARIVIGTSFSWWDVLCYVIGFAFLFVLDKDLRKKH
ncbi:MULTISPECIES: DUF2809 domain-containing protein [unclassified Flavobacterium]|uniref:ribosomal maturation YjgA family protein n=1 Tax=unclassified Flavobacterium TaxID=196869 RepID=UPI0013D52C5E|nr:MULTISPECIES: DUF2809 domain-containing protein [unclassified Flavobacterium]MBA5792441.1 DUF2809 domain-containing protein [Flavobacterium sp. xlx-221]